MLIAVELVMHSALMVAGSLNERYSSKLELFKVVRWKGGLFDT